MEYGFWDGITCFCSYFPCDHKPEVHTHQKAALSLDPNMAISEGSRCNKEIQSEDWGPYDMKQFKASLLSIQKPSLQVSF